MIIQNNASPNVRIGDVYDEWIKSYSPISINTFDENSFVFFREKIDLFLKNGFDTIPIIIDTLGGEVSTLLGIVDIIEELERLNKTIITFSSCKSLSSGGVLIAFGTKGYRYISPNSTLMLHQCSGGYIGKIAEGESMLKYHKKQNNSLFKKLDKRCGKQSGFFKKEIKHRENSEWFLSPKEAVKHGLCDHIGIPKITLNLGFEICVE